MPIRVLYSVMLLAVSLASQGASGLEARAAEGGARRPHVHGSANLDISIDGFGVEVVLVAPGATLVGFEHAPRSDTELETLRLARANLEAGDGMIRFNTNAACRLVESRVETDLPEWVPGEEPAAQPHADIRADYRFECQQPRALDSAALGLFVGFPALRRVLVHYAMPEGRGAAELTRANPVVSFIPF